MVVDGLDTCVNILQISNASSSSSPPRTPSPAPIVQRPSEKPPQILLFYLKKDITFQCSSPGSLISSSSTLRSVHTLIACVGPFHPPPPELHSSLGSASTSRNLPIRHSLHLGYLCRLVTTPQASTKLHPPPAHSNLRLFSPKFAQNREVHSRRFRIDLFESSCYSSSNTHI